MEIDLFYLTKEYPFLAVFLIFPHGKFRNQGLDVKLLGQAGNDERYFTSFLLVEMRSNKLILDGYDGLDIFFLDPGDYSLRKIRQMDS